MRQLAPDERIGLRNLLDARRRDVIATRGACLRLGKLHGAAMPFPPRPVRHIPEVRLPTLDEYECNPT